MKRTEAAEGVASAAAPYCSVILLACLCSALRSRGHSLHKKRMIRYLLPPLFLLFNLIHGPAASACSGAVTVCSDGKSGSFGLVRKGKPAAVYVDAGADTAVRRAAHSFGADLAKVAGRQGAVITDPRSGGSEVVIIGVLGQSPLVDDLAARAKVETAGLQGQWEAYRQVVVERPFAGVDRALLVLGSDRRGAVFGTYDLSRKLGMSPWHWWADVPVEQRSDVFLTPGSRYDQPKVKYRGFFINDEEPAFGNWAREKFGGINSKLYEKVFELNLRLKGNYLWPAMWGKAFNDDDPRNMVLADEMGVIMGTSHHEPMMRAQDEWHRNKEGGVTGGRWDYTQNAQNLRTFWRGGIERMASKPGPDHYESLVTVGMRGDGDEPMTEGTATRLLESIVADQRRIIEEVTGTPAAETPQVWALYKEVQDYFDKGMKVPEDVLLLFADDNWGQIRRLPTADRHRKGGHGVYYHFDYVGGPRNYKWLNTNQIGKVWQQMNLAYESGADDLWIVNVGDIKPMEFPLTFFMDMAWNPEAMTLEALAAYPQDWAAATFGKAHAREIATLLTRYSQIAARRKPELLSAGDFGGEGSEFNQLAAELEQMERKASELKGQLTAAQQDAFFQLVEHPISALSNLYRLYRNVARNHALAAAGDPAANLYADRAEAAFRRDKEIAARYHALAGGKWNHMMAQTHIGYTGWQQPEADVMPEVKRTAAGTVPLKPLPKNAVASHEIVIEAHQFKNSVSGSGHAWRVIPHLGRSRGAVTAFPQGQPATSPKDEVRIEFEVLLQQEVEAGIELHMIPTLDVRGAGGLRVGLSVDDGPVEVLRFNLIPDAPDWNWAVTDNIHVLQGPRRRLSAGTHRIKIWRIDSNVVLDRIVVRTGGAGSAVAEQG